MPDCESRDFDAQIAASAIAMLQYIKEIIISLSDYLVFEPDIFTKSQILGDYSLKGTCES
jgi:hypothetical protein